MHLLLQVNEWLLAHREKPVTRAIEIDYESDDRAIAGNALSLARAGASCPGCHAQPSGFSQGCPEALPIYNLATALKKRSSR